MRTLFECVHRQVLLTWDLTRNIAKAFKNPAITGSSTCSANFPINNKNTKINLSIRIKIGIE